MTITLIGRRVARSKLYLLVISVAFLAIAVGCGTSASDDDPGPEPISNNPLACPGLRCSTVLPRCEGDEAVLSSWDTSDCSCNLVEDRTDCSAQGQVCRQGQCRQEEDPCATVQCPQRQPTCENNDAVVFTGPGTCDPSTGRCDYSGAEMRTTCQEEDSFCRQGVCRISDDPCATNPCTQPDDFCDGNTLVTYSGAGMCQEDGSCDLSGVEGRMNCEDNSLVCRDGACVEDMANGCEDVMCTAPMPSCEDTKAITYSGNGTCDEATEMCDFSSVRVETECADLSQVCSMGACVDEADPCANQMCEPPMPNCDGQMAVTYSGNGMCNMNDGTCDFSVVRMTEDCAGNNQMCVMGMCQAMPDLCDSVTCDMPPAPSCDSTEPDVAITYAATGTCDPEDGSCSYEETRTNCADQSMSCVDGMCM